MTALRIAKRVRREVNLAPVNTSLLSLARPDLEAGICGEHGGDPDSIALCRQLELDYVSCSPPRVPVARLAAARAAITDPTDLAAYPI